MPTHHSFLWYSLCKSLQNYDKGQLPKTVKLHPSNHLICYASRKDSFDNNTSGLSSHNSKTQASAIVDQLNGLHMLPLGKANPKKQKGQCEYMSFAKLDCVILIHNDISV